MSKSISGLFNGTKGSKTYNNNLVALAKYLSKKAFLWSKNKKNELTKISKNKANKFNTCTIAYDSKNDKIYYGMNQGIKINNSIKNTIIFGNNKHKGLLPEQSLNNYELGNCAEIDAINNALNDGVKLNNIMIYTIHTTNNMFGLSKTACENCTFAFKGKIKYNFTGWSSKKEE